MEAMAVSPPPLIRGGLTTIQQPSLTLIKGFNRNLTIASSSLPCPTAVSTRKTHVAPEETNKLRQHDPLRSKGQLSPQASAQNRHYEKNSFLSPEANNRSRTQNSRSRCRLSIQASVQNSLSETQNSPSVPLPSHQKIQPLPQLQDYIQPLPQHINPLLHSQYFHPTYGFWLSDSDMVAQNTAMDINDPSSHTQTYFHRAGPRYHVAFTPEEVGAAIVTCGGLCPGLNTVVRELVDALWYQYGVRQIHGIQGGYRGFYSCNTLTLNPHLVDGWHRSGGTKLGTSRGGFDLVKIVDAIEHRGLNQIYIIGGDGTMRGAVAIYEEVRRRGLKVSVVGIPKTVDNDVGIIDRSFGFQTAVEKAQEAVNAAHVEAESTPNGMGLVKLMGRNAGHIAVHATLGSRDVDCCLIPEVPFFMDGPGGLLDFIEQRLNENGHCVLVVAEGAGQELMESASIAKERDMSGNPLLQDIGLWLGKRLKDWWKSKHPNELFALKYIDPTYMIRAVPSNATDTSYCTLLAHSALHGAMAGYTGFVAGPINGRFCYIPLDLVAKTQHTVDVNNHTWAWVKSVNNQPDFIRLENDKEEDNATTHNY